MAEDYCHTTYNTHLATIVSASDQEIATEICIAASSTHNAFCWIGLHDWKVNGYWEWADNSTKYNDSHHELFWKLNEPSPLLDEDCVYIGSDKDFEWNDLDCDGDSKYNVHIKHFLCDNPEYDADLDCQCC